VRWIALVAAAALLVIAFAAAGRVTDTREGLVAEIVTLLGGASGFLLLIYAYAARKRPASRVSTAGTTTPPAAYVRSSRDLLLGGSGIALAIVLLAGLAFSGGPLWAGFGFAILLPMLAGSIYLCVRYLRANP
jgi:hypothetical protein